MRHTKATLLAFMVGTACAVAPAHATGPTLPATYLVRGQARATIAGPGCCSGTVFGGTAEVGYAIDASGQATFSRIEVHLDDVDVPIHDMFDLEVGRLPVRCATVATLTPAVGLRDLPRRIKLPGGALQLLGTSFQTRLTDGSCADSDFVLQASNDADVFVDHDPDANRFHLAGAFPATYSGKAYLLSLQIDAPYTDRPPVARQGVIYPGHTQGGCPNRWIDNPAGWVAEANVTGGLRASLRSDSSDPDGSWARADVGNERWFWGPDATTFSELGPGRALGPYRFGMGTVHHVHLFASDFAGATSDDSCVFRVVDTMPPTVTPPGPGTVACTVAGGATPGTSSPLQAFLTSARATDVADGAPTLLTPLASGVPVTNTTLFKLDIDTGGAGTPVTFRSSDASGNIGGATATLHVVDGEPPTGSAAASPSVIPPTGALYAIAAAISASDRCGTVRVWLDSIKSNAPALDAADVSGAAYGSDDRSFALRGRLAAAGVPRVYTIVYGVQDRSGNTAWLRASVTVNP